MTDAFHLRDVVALSDFPKEAVVAVLDDADRIRKEGVDGSPFAGTILASCFFEPSTRTRLSFESAAVRLGGSCIGFSGDTHTSVSKGEGLYDTMRTIEHYADIIVLRHPREGAARLAAEYTDIPVINAGDGSRHHPTQTLIDLYSMRESQNRLHDLHIAVVGDLRYGRTVHSLIEALSLFDVQLSAFALPQLTLPNNMLGKPNIKEYAFSELPAHIETIDILYVTRLQKERFDDGVELHQLKRQYVIDNMLLARAKPTMRLLHPLPRVNEIPTAVDRDPRAYYFRQVQNGLFVRMALLQAILQ